MSTFQLLEPRGQVPFIGPETGVQKPGISVFKSIDGSVRYVLYVGRLPIAALQIVVPSGRPHHHPDGSPIVANVYTAIGCRGRGHARTLFEAAKLAYPTLRHAAPVDRTDAGAGWVKSLSRRRSIFGAKRHAEGGGGAVRVSGAAGVRPPARKQ